MNRILSLGYLLLTVSVSACAANQPDPSDGAKESSADIVTADGANAASVQVTASNSVCDSCSGGETVVMSWVQVMLNGEFSTFGTIGGAASYGCTGSWALTSHGFFRDTYTVTVTCPSGRAPEWAVWAESQAQRAEQ